MALYPTRLATWLRGGSSGHTLTEAVVALALFVGVLTPAAAVVTGFLAQRNGAREVEALATAQRTLEAMLQTRGSGEAEWVTDDGRWVVRRTIAPAGALLLFRVEVASPEATAPLVALTTLRSPPNTDWAGFP